MLAPGATEGADQDPKELVPGAEPEPPSGGPTQDGELLAKQEVLGDQVGAATQHGAEQTDEKAQVLKHHPQLLSPRDSPVSGLTFSLLQVDAAHTTSFTISSTYSSSLRPSSSRSTYSVYSPKSGAAKRIGTGPSVQRRGRVSCQVAPTSACSTDW